jgi:hypothetical protein
MQLDVTIFVARDETYESGDGFTDGFAIECHRTGVSGVLDLDGIQRLVRDLRVVFSDFQIDLACTIEIEPCEGCGSDLICIPPERGNSLTLHVPEWRGVDGDAGSKWTSRAGIARHKDPSDD